ncbi:MAG: DUF4926 domain-containing protein [Leptolyngbya sp. LCM1.Bin17]|nr:MAG: DUF4926 domain-containing protein [Leptolyngbya sp. LCM1.Bin17]
MSVAQRLYRAVFRHYCYSCVSLNRDFPKYNLRQGNIATFIDTVPAPDDGEEGYILEVFNALGKSIDVVTVSKSAVAAVRSHLKSAG